MLVHRPTIVPTRFLQSHVRTVTQQGYHNA